MQISYEAQLIILGAVIGGVFSLATAFAGALFKDWLDARRAERERQDEYRKIKVATIDSFSAGVDISNGVASSGARVSGMFVDSNEEAQPPEPDEGEQLPELEDLRRFADTLDKADINPTLAKAILELIQNYEGEHNAPNLKEEITEDK